MLIGILACASVALVSIAVVLGVQWLPALLTGAAVVSAAISPGLWRGRPALPLISAVALVVLTVGAGLISRQPQLPSTGALLFVIAGTWSLQMLIERIYASTTTHVSPVRSAEWTAVSPHEVFGRALFDEMARSRRHSRPFAVVVIRFERSVQAASLNDFHALDETICAGTRWADRAFFGARPEDLVMICPESEAGAIEPLADRLREALSQGAFGQVKIGWAVFPEDGLACETLLDLADQRADSGQRPDDERSVQRDGAESVRMYGTS